MRPADFGLRPDGYLTCDLAILRAVTRGGLLRGVRPLEALVAVRRARTYGDGEAPLVAAVRKLAGSTAGRTHGVPAGRPA